MKKRHQIIGLLASRKPATDKDKLAIIAFCKKKRFQNIYFKGSSDSDNSPQEPITFEQFVEWYNTRHYIPGEVITDKSGSVFLITHFVEGQSISKAHLNTDRELSTDPVIVPRDDGSREASFEEKLSLQRALSRLGLCWNPHEKIITGKSIPDDSRYISMWVLEEKIGLGIFRDVDPEGNLILYCFSDGKNPAVLDEGYTLGPLGDYTVKKALLFERSKIIEELNQINLRWAGRRLRFEPINLRRKKGTYYHYITNCGQIKRAAENGRDVDNCRFKIGNYFHAPEEAELFLSHIILERNKHLSGNLNLE